MTPDQIVVGKRVIAPFPPMSALSIHTSSTGTIVDSGFYPDNVFAIVWDDVPWTRCHYGMHRLQYIHEHP
jgi:hypothetical protein